MNTNTTLRNTLQAALLTATLLLGISAAQAQLVTNNIAVQNFSFETPVTADYVNINGGLPGWSAPANVNTYVVKNGGLVNFTSGVTGNQALFFEPYADGGNSYVYQNTREVFDAGTYTMTVDIGYGLGFATDGGNATANFQLLSYNGISYNYSVGAAATTVSAATLAGHNGNLQSYTFTLNLNGTESFIGDDVVIFLQAQTTTPGTFQNVSYDNVQLNYVAAVPEPSTYALVLGGIATLLLIRRRVQS
jgi:hypothetical protein